MAFRLGIGSLLEGLQDELEANENDDDESDSADNDEDYEKKSDTAEDFSDITELADDLQTAMQVGPLTYPLFSQINLVPKTKNMKNFSQRTKHQQEAMIMMISKMQYRQVKLK